MYLKAMYVRKPGQSVCAATVLTVGKPLPPAEERDLATGKAIIPVIRQSATPTPPAQNGTGTPAPAPVPAATEPAGDTYTEKFMVVMVNGQPTAVDPNDADNAVVGDLLVDT